MFRRDFLGLVGAGLGVAFVRPVEALAALDAPAADATVHISPVTIEVAPRKMIKTTGYNGSVPGPFLHFREGQQVTVDVFNDTNKPELLHWHGLFIPPDVDGSMEEGTPMIPPKSSKRYTFIARPAGLRWYHTHVSAGFDLSRGTYSGQFGMLYIEPKDEPGRYDAEVPLILHGWEPNLTGGDEEGGGVSEVAYRIFSINGHALGSGEPIRVRAGQKVLFRILNASATLQHQVALAGHKFTVISLDGNLVPTPRSVDVLSLGPAERVEAVVSMDAPGVWVLGEVDAPTRNKGLGIVVEYENRNEAPRWNEPSTRAWDYTVFGASPGASAGAAAATPGDVEVIPLVFTRKFVAKWFEHWMINGKEFPKTDPIMVRANQRYRLRFDNQSDDDHPVHLHRHSFELKEVAGSPTAGIFKDVVVVPARKVVEAELVADNPGATLFHCHNQMHMDFGFMTLFKYAG
jgi:FtsP/CotA-like multicopper oxidase with cupredoxin domain